jgi:hypothetical protein
LDAEPGAAGTAVVVAFPAAAEEGAASADPSTALEAVGAPAPADLDFFFLIFLVWKQWVSQHSDNIGKM